MATSKMLQEIAQQPEALERTINSGLAAAEQLRRRFADRKPRLVVLAARGTSDNAAQFGRYLLEISTGIPVSLAAPSIYTLYNAPLDLKDVLVVAISQSGESTDTNLVVQRAAAQGAFTLGITNEASSALARDVDHLFLVCAGSEVSVAATKTYTGQLLMFYLLAYALGAPISLDELRRLPHHASAALTLYSEIAAHAARYRSMEHAVVVARGLNYANAFEFALKLMETCYVVAERFSAADFLHGPIAMLEPSFPVFLYAPSGVTWKGISDLMASLHKIKAQTLVITDLANRAAVESAACGELNHSLCIPVDLASRNRPADLYTAIPYIIPAQLFAACLAELKGLDPDCPRALNKITRTL
jgi:glucosamine--fructose-6-phosphate aminotransferase (isomerizing)